MRIFVHCILFSAIFSLPTRLLAWGERGHAIVSRVAVRLLLDMQNQNKQQNNQFAKLFVQKEYLLSHLANVPDIVWRSSGKDIEKLNAPTHYFDIEYLGITQDKVQKNSPAHGIQLIIPRTYYELQKLLQELCKGSAQDYTCPSESAEKVNASDMGSSPFRIQQLFWLLKNTLDRAEISYKKDSQSGGKEFTELVTEALVVSGILSHFVGDMANPFHSTKDYDGYESNKGGIHGYFETEVVNSYDLALEGEVFQYAHKQNPFLALQFPDDKKLTPPEQQTKSWKDDPLLVAYALTLDSFTNLPEALQLDQKHAVLTPSKRDHGLKIPATRKPAQDVALAFKPLIIKRLALGAATLAHLWNTAWNLSRKPNVAVYKSFEYPLTPTFIAPDYALSKH